MSARCDYLWCMCRSSAVMDQARINSFQYSQLTSNMLRKQGIRLSTKLPRREKADRIIQTMHSFQEVRPYRPIFLHQPCNQEFRYINGWNQFDRRSNDDCFPFTRWSLPCRNSTSTGLRTYQDIVDSGAYRQPDHQPRPTSRSLRPSRHRCSLFRSAQKCVPNRRKTDWHTSWPIDLIRTRDPTNPSRSLHPSGNSIDSMNVGHLTFRWSGTSPAISVVLEVEERQQFLEQMTICGKRREYQPVIANEIADVCSAEKICFISLLVSILRKYVKWNTSIGNVQRRWNNVCNSCLPRRNNGNIDEFYS